MLHFAGESARRRKLIASFLAPVAVTIFLVATDNMPAQAAPLPVCSVPAHWYGQGGSGTSNFGSADTIKTWASWNVPNEAGGNFSDEAVWSIDANNMNNALEVGCFTGWGSGNLSGGSNHTNGMIPYYTLNQGDNEYDYWGDFLPRNTEISMFAQATNAGSDFAYVDGLIDTKINYPVSQPRWGFTQGEVNDNAATMGGGSGGDESTVMWIDSAGAFHDWAYINTCANSPYWSGSTNGTDDFENGGPG